MEGRPLEGRTAIVTGASSGIGLAVTNALADGGARVHAVSRRPEAITRGAGKKRVSSGRVVPHALDVSDREGVERLVRNVGEEEGVGILVLAAGTNVPNRRLDRVTPEDWDRVLSVNLSGAFYFVKAALPYLRAARGDAVLVGSVSGMWPDVSGAAYQASKLGLAGLARAAGFEEHARGVRFSNIMPGIVDTPLLDSRPEPPPREVRERALRPEDVARACLFLVTLPERAYVPELTIVPTELQALGKTSTATPPVPPAEGS